MKTCTFQFANGTTAPSKNIPVTGPKAAPTKDIDSCTKFPPTSRTKYETPVHRTPNTATVVKKLNV